MRRWPVVLALVATSLAARGDFVDLEVGSRGMSMGGAFVAMEGDPANLFWNPAAVHSDVSLQLQGMRTRLFDGVEGLDEDYLGVSHQLRENLAAAFGWTRTALEDLYHEDVLSLGLATRLLDGRISLGVAGLLYGADAPGYEALNDPNYSGAQWEFSAGVGALYRHTENLRLGASAENLLRPTIQLVSTSTDVQEIGGRRRFGAAYRLQEIVWLTAELRHHDVPAYVGGEWTLHGGAESWFQEVFAVRAGVNDGELSAGIGLFVRGVRLDLALLSHERLGNSYRAALKIGF